MPLTAGSTRMELNERWKRGAGLDVWLTVFVCPSIAQAGCEHVLPQGALLFVKGDYVGCDHPYKHLLLLHTLLRPDAPLHVFINGADLLLGARLLEFWPGIVWGEETWKKASCDDDGDQKGEVMDLLGAIIFLHDKVVRAIDILFVDLIRNGKVFGKGGLVEFVLQGLEIEVGRPPRGPAVGSDRVVVGDGLGLDGGGTDGYDVRIEGRVILRGPEAEVTPIIKQGHLVRSAPRSGVVLVGREKMYLENDEGGPDGLVEKDLLLDESLHVNDLEDGCVSDFENREEGAILQNRGDGGDGAGRVRHVDQELSEIMMGLGVVVPSTKSASEGGVIL